MTEVSLPSYENPPLVETILNVQFEPLRGLKAAHLGAFWKQLGADWTTADDAPIVEPMFERFSEEDRSQELGLSLMLLKAPPVRLQLRNGSDDGMIQIQNGRLIYNWLKKEGRVYPRYEIIRESFAASFRQLCAFVESEKLGEVQPNQWEITYLNHIPQDTVWKTIRDWSFFHPIGRIVEVEGLTTLDSLSEKWRYVIGDNLGRLHISWQHARKDDRQEMVVLNLTARGPLGKDTTGLGAVLEGLDLGRLAIVRSFATCMTSDANNYWGLKHADI